MRPSIWFSFPQEKRKKRHQNPNKQKTPEHYRIFKPQTGNWGSAPCFAEWMSRLRCFCIYKVKRSDVEQQGSKLQNTRHEGALFVDKVCLRFNLLQLYRSGPLAQIRCTELVAGEAGDTPASRLPQGYTVGWELPRESPETHSSMWPRWLSGL